jgi:cysteine desulfurase/selenocysteine lyase
VLVDGAQSIAALPVDVQTLGVDFLAFATRCAARRALGCCGGGRAFSRVPPFLGGGDMIGASTAQFRSPSSRTSLKPGRPRLPAIGFGAAVAICRVLAARRFGRTAGDHRVCP